MKYVNKMIAIIKHKFQAAYHNWRMSPEERWLNESTNLSELESRLQSLMYGRNNNHKGGLG